MLLEMIERLGAKKGLVNWKLVDKKPGIWSQVANCNYAISLLKLIDLKVVGISGEDLARGDRKLILALMSQLMRAHVLRWAQNQARSEAACKLIPLTLPPT